MRRDGPARVAVAGIAHTVESGRPLAGQNFSVQPTGILAFSRPPGLPSTVPRAAPPVPRYLAPRLREALRDNARWFRAAMAESVALARNLFYKGLPLARMVNGRLALDLELFSRGGLKILDKIAHQRYDVLTRRPKISKTERAGVLLSSLLRWSLARVA